MPILGNFAVAGSLLLQFKEIGWSVSNLFRIGFDTAFIPSNNILEIDRFQISPEDLHKDHKRFVDDFHVKIEFEDFCQ